MFELCPTESAAGLFRRSHESSCSNLSQCITSTPLRFRRRLQLFPLRDRGLRFVHLKIFLRQVCQVRPAQVVSHRRTRASRVHVRSSPPRRHVVHVHRAEINAEPRLSGIVWHARMHLRGGEQQNASRRRKHSNLRIQLHRFFRLRLFPRVLLDELRGILPARAVPFRVVVFHRSVAHGLTPITRM